ncbi:transposase [Wenzhouxiangella sp. C33]|uniref:Transposase n=1 Tax=Wenzhouxiangella limi TaxID=2707351 RepID=A0A845UUZ5_9GAMM|nr:transposase [Wenzhouxiangella limi]
MPAAFLELRWPEGFRCPKCGNSTCCAIGSRKVFQCHRCHHQVQLHWQSKGNHLPGEPGT